MTGAGFLPAWTATMAAVMLPSTVPLLRLDYATTRSKTRVGVLAGGYFAVWLALGCVVVAADSLIGMHGHRTTSALLAVAALYQLRPGQAPVPDTLPRPAEQAHARGRRSARAG